MSLLRCAGVLRGVCTRPWLVVMAVLVLSGCARVTYKKHDFRDVVVEIEGVRVDLHLAGYWSRADSAGRAIEVRGAPYVLQILVTGPPDVLPNVRLMDFELEGLRSGQTINRPGRPRLLRYPFSDSLAFSGALLDLDLAYEDQRVSGVMEFEKDRVVVRREFSTVMERAYKEERRFILLEILSGV